MRNYFELLTVSEIIGDDYNPNCWNLSGFKYAALWLSCLAAQVLSIMLGCYLHDILIFLILYAGTVVISHVLLYSNDNNDMSVFLIVMLSGLIALFLGFAGILHD